MASGPGSASTPWSVDRLLRSIAVGGDALVALSGGVDSGTVAALAVEALGQRATAATLTGPAVGGSEVARAQEVARRLGIRHVLVEVDPLSVEGYRTNPSNRCYFCRRTETIELRRWGGEHGVAQYLDGVHRDDLSDDRPGLRAMDEASFVHPLLSAGWGKGEVRRFARERGLPNWDAPSDACLASRIPHGRSITEELLTRIGSAEEAVRAYGFRRVRVRVEGSGARVVVDRAEVPRLSREPTAGGIRAALIRLGFERVEFDPSGYAPRANG